MRSKQLGERSLVFGNPHLTAFHKRILLAEEYAHFYANLSLTFDCCIVIHTHVQSNVVHRYVHIIIDRVAQYHMYCTTTTITITCIISMSFNVTHAGGTYRTLEETCRSRTLQPIWAKWAYSLILGCCLCIHWTKYLRYHRQDM